MLIDAKLFIIILGFSASILPIITDLFILPSKIKQYKNQDTTLFEQHFRNIIHLAFFYILFISFLIALYNHLFSMKIEYPIRDFFIIISIVIFIFWLINKSQYYEVDKSLIFHIEPCEGLIFLGFFTFLIVFSVFNIFLVSIIFDKSISIIFIISIVVLIFIYDKMTKN